MNPLPPIDTKALFDNDGAIQALRFQIEDRKKRKRLRLKQIKANAKADITVIERRIRSRQNTLLKREEAKLFTVKVPDPLDFRKSLGIPADGLGTKLNKPLDTLTG